MHARVLAIDYGEKRVGIAISDPLGLTAQPYPFFVNDARLLDNLRSLIDEKDIKKIVLGYPKTLRNTHSEQTDRVAAFRQILEEEFALEVIYEDERLSSQAAQKQLRELDMTHKKQRGKIDSQAAAFFLKTYLDRIR